MRQVRPAASPSPSAASSVATAVRFSSASSGDAVVTTGVWSSSVTTRAAVEGSPAVTRSGRGPKPKVTVCSSSSSSTSSSTTVTVKVRAVSPAAKVTEAGTPARSSCAGVTVSGISTVRSGSASSRTSSATPSPSATEYSAAPNAAATGGAARVTVTV